MMFPEKKSFDYAVSFPFYKAPWEGLGISYPGFNKAALSAGHLRGVSLPFPAGGRSQPPLLRDTSVLFSAVIAKLIVLMRG